MRRGRKRKRMIVTDPEHGTREWSEDPVGDLLEMYKTIKEIAERIQKDLESFLAALEQGVVPLWETPGWAIHNKRHYRTRRVQPKLHLNTVPLGTGTYLYKAKEMKNLARSTKTHPAPKKGEQKSEQCQHTFRITSRRCAPCDGYNKECEEYSVAHDHP